ncbi:hypothetical protein C8N47_103141 [Mangrovibacterium marinum]|uniref:Nucleotide-binding universal stress UspA family protein n=2 Tax=Mangrovibacterium marinum TaxID=1639118 RepID=A0A2T5C4S6_9BACT|nr:hypothetical protein C8N47_103141 [Mangrovibacterium marinum]
MVYCDFSETMNDAIAHGLRVSQIFQKELCLFHPYGKGHKERKLDAQRTLGLLIRRLKEDFPTVTMSSLTLKGNLEQGITRIAEEYDGIMLVLSSDKLKPKIRALQQSQIPFLFVNGSTSHCLGYDQVMLPVDYRKVMKDTSLWASYFARFNQSAINVLCARENAKENQKMVKKNRLFIEQLLRKFKVNAHIEQAQKGSFGLPTEALERSKTRGDKLMIIPASQHINLIDLLVGLPETKLIRQAKNIQVMCINPKRDMYILCD